jgi:hypothetical protein
MEEEKEEKIELYYKEVVLDRLKCKRRFARSNKDWPEIDQTLTITNFRLLF